MTYDVKDQEKVSKYHSFMEQCSRLEFSSKDFICSNLLNSKKVAPVSHNSCFFVLFFLFFFQRRLKSYLQFLILST